MIWRSVVLVAAALLTSDSTSAQLKPSLEQLLDRMGAYLTEYETQLSSVVADESFDQKVVYMPGLKASSIISRRLDSEVSFMRLPGGAEWLGFRDVRRVNGRRLRETGPRIHDLLVSGGDAMVQAKAIADASARHNLGLPRTINLPTAALDIIHPRHREAHRFELCGHERVGGTATTIVGFREVRRPTLVREPTGENLVSSGRIWVAPGSGAVSRVEWVYHTESRSTHDPPPSLRVTFAHNRELGLMVPDSMVEVFDVMRARGEGRATYRNFRRFGTSARIVPQSQ